MFQEVLTHPYAVTIIGGLSVAVVLGLWYDWRRSRKEARETDRLRDEQLNKVITDLDTHKTDDIYALANIELRLDEGGTKFAEMNGKIGQITVDTAINTTHIETIKETQAEIKNQQVTIIDHLIDIKNGE